MNRLLPPLIACLALAGCGEPNAFVPPPPPVVEVAHPAQRDTVTFRSFPGRLEASDSVRIVARVKGFLEEILFEDGQRFDAGAPLFVIEPETYDARFQAAEAALEQATASAKLADTRLQQQQELFSRNAISRIDFFTAQADYEAAQGAVGQARANLAAAAIERDYTRIAAPFAGRISESAVSVGNLVGGSGPETLALLVQDDPVHVYFSVPEREVLRFLAGHDRDQGSSEIPSLKLVLSDGSEFPAEGTVTYVSNTVNPGTASLEVRATFPNPQGTAIPGMFGEIRVPRPISQAILVPRLAIQRDQGGDYALVIGEGGTVERRGVTLGPIAGSDVVILEGLTPADSLVVKGLQRARPGGTVTPKPVAGPGQPANAQPPAEG